MAQSKATTVDAYLAELPAERASVIAAVRKMILKHLPKGYRESMNWGMISYEVPLERYPTTYNKQPLAYAALAAQKNHFALYLTCVYGNPEQERRLAEAFSKAGKKLDMGKSCLRFRALEDLPLDDLGQIIASTPPEKMIARYESARAAK